MIDDYFSKYERFDKPTEFTNKDFLSKLDALNFVDNVPETYSYSNQKYESFLLPTEPVILSTILTTPALAVQNNIDSSISLDNLLKLEGIDVRITSKFRPGAKTALNRTSNHSKKDKYGESMAIDLVPTDGNFNNLLSKLYSNPRILQWLRDRGYGILEETTPEIMRRTGASGKHLHIGPDSKAKGMTIRRTNDREFYSQG